ncbi:MAG TPA: twin-arginine translocase TatA/TatE family subunit [Solirubrobacterales bacterium]|jgi:sec-independent protein translocase protein TatA
MFSGLENPTHWLVVIAIALVLFGPKRLPELGRSLGTGMRGFKDALEGRDDPPPLPSAEAELPGSEPPASPQR